MTSGAGSHAGHRAQTAKGPRNDAEETRMTTETIVPDTQQTYGADTLESERGLMLAVLVMVVLGVAGMFLVSA
jgi:hypothetical protein